MTRFLPVGVTRQHLRKKVPTILGWKIFFGNCGLERLGKDWGKLEGKDVGRPQNLRFGRWFSFSIGWLLGSSGEFFRGFDPFRSGFCIFLHPSTTTLPKLHPFFLGFGEAKGQKIPCKNFPPGKKLRVWEPFLGPGEWNRDPNSKVAGGSLQRLLREVPVSLGIVENSEIAMFPAMFGQVVVEAEIFPRILHCLKAPTADFGGGWMTWWTMNDHETRAVTSTTHQARWWLEIFFIFTPKIGEMIQFDYLIF